MTVTYSLFVAFMRKHSDVYLKQYGYGLAWDTHVTGPSALMVRWKLVHSLVLGLHMRFHTCGLRMSQEICREWVTALVGHHCRYLAHYPHKPRFKVLAAYWSSLWFQSLGIVWFLFVVIWGLVLPFVAQRLEGHMAPQFCHGHHGHSVQASRLHGYGRLVLGVGLGVWFVGGLPLGVSAVIALVVSVGVWGALSPSHVWCRCPGWYSPWWRRTCPGFSWP